MNIKKTVIESFILIALLTLTLLMLLKNQDISQILYIIKNCNPAYIAAGICAMVLYVFLGGNAIRILLESRGYKMSVFRCFKYSLTEVYFSSITPSSTGGQPMAALSMRNDKYPLTETTPALFAIAGLYKFGLMFLGVFFCIIFGGKIFGGANTWVLILFVIGFIINFIIVFIIWLFLFSNRFIWYFFKIILNLGCFLKIIKDRRKTIRFLRNKRAEYMKCAGYIKECPKLILNVFLNCIAQRLAISSVSSFVYMSMGLGDFSIGCFLYIIAIQVVAAVAVEILPLPGAIGISETVFLALYIPLYHTPEMLNAGMLLTRGISFYCLFIASGIFINICYVTDVVKNFRNRGIYK